jgi:hypothetical protein
MKLLSVNCKSDDLEKTMAQIASSGLGIMKITPIDSVDNVILCFTADEELLTKVILMFPFGTFKEVKWT